MPCKEEEDEIIRWSSESRVKLALAMPKYRANESRDKLAWLCRVQPIFNEVNRDRGRQGQPMEQREQRQSLLWLCRVVTEEDKVNLRHALQRRGETDVWANRNHGYTA